MIEEQTSTAAVDYVFKVMGANYGASWDRSLGTAPIADVKTAWMEAMDSFMHSPEAKRSIVWALKNLPENVPNPRQFRALCMTAPSKPQPMLPSPTVNKELAARVLGAIKPQQAVDCKEWARVILRDHEAGAKRTPTVLQMARNALA